MSDPYNSQTPEGWRNWLDIARRSRDWNMRQARVARERGDMATVRWRVAHARRLNRRVLLYARKLCFEEQIPGEYVHLGYKHGGWGITLDWCERIWHANPDFVGLELCTDSENGYLALIPRNGEERSEWKAG